MDLCDNELYMQDVRYAANLVIPWEKLENRILLLSGATGLIGSFLVDVLMERNASQALNCTIYALVRNAKRAKARFRKYADSGHLIVVPYDVTLPLNLTTPLDANSPLKRTNTETVDYVLHLASNTHPLQYSTDPIGTIVTNIIGLQNMLEFAVNHKAARFTFASSNEIYGENRGDVEFFDEAYCGYLNCNTMRAGYPESKRCGEALCQAYRAQKGLDVVIPRFTRSYGPTMLMSDTKAISQFIKKGISGENIVLKSAGTQYYSYQYVTDSVCGLLYVLLCGENGEAYNVAEEHSDIMLKDLASIVAGINGKKVVFEVPDAVETAGYSTATKARLDGRKLQSLGWKPKYDIETGLRRTIEILKELQ